jgi:hypothetical protein
MPLAETTGALYRTSSGEAVGMMVAVVMSLAVSVELQATQASK